MAKLISKASNHGNCVPFFCVNTKSGSITYRNSLKAIAKYLKISEQRASMAHRNNNMVKKGKSLYTIHRMGYDTTITFTKL